MADDDNAPHPDESSPLLGNGHPEEREREEDEEREEEKAVTRAAANAKIEPPSQSALVKGTPAPHSGSIGYAWAADGLPAGRAQWDSSLFACFGRNDEFCGSDVEVCLLGTLAPCVLYGSNAERLGSASGGKFANHCLAYCGVYLFGSSFFGCNLTPFFSYATRTAIRRRFHLEASYLISYPCIRFCFPCHEAVDILKPGMQGNCEALHRSCGCCGSIVEDEVQLDQCESGCDLLTHVCCHACALCQEAREVRRRLPHLGFNAQPVLVMVPPVEQTMGREA